MRKCITGVGRADMWVGNLSPFPDPRPTKVGPYLWQARGAVHDDGTMERYQGMAQEIGYARAVCDPNQRTSATCDPVEVAWVYLLDPVRKKIVVLGAEETNIHGTKQFKEAGAWDVDGPEPDWSEIEATDFTSKPVPLRDGTW